MIKNITKKTILANGCRTCDNFLSRGIGLMFAKRITPTVLVFGSESTASIHTYFVRHYLDVVFLNEDCEVVDLVQGLSPNNVYSPKKKARFVVELPEGAIAKSKTEVGDFVNVSA